MRYLVVLIALCATPCAADVKLPKILGSNMVLEREADIELWGWADPQESIQVRGDWLEKPATTTAAADGKWRVGLKTGPAGGPHTIDIIGKNTIHLDQVLFGEVWIGSGQSNMEMPLIKVSDAYTGIKNSAEEVAAADHPQIRLFQAGNFSSKEPLEDVEPGISMYGIPPAECQWRPCSPDTVKTFASTGYFFARELHDQLQIPIGIIDASWGGTPAEAWTPAAGLKALGYTAALDQAASLPQQSDQKIPTRLYNGMIHPLRRFTIKGVIWYQGEGNAGQADKYQQLFSTMIGQWRSAFGYEFPFYFVQIAPFKYGGLNAAYLREAQTKTLSVARTGMAVTIDIGNLADIHPKNKQEVGRRLALWALAKDYDREMVYSGPLFKTCTFDGGRARLKFDNVGSGLATLDGKDPSEFEVAGADKVFHPAIAKIDSGEVVVSCPEVAEPKAVRYAFHSESIPNLINHERLPASSFRTDDW